MGGYNFGAPTSNNAPQPIPGGYGNATGFNYGSPTTNSAALPNYPVFGPMGYGGSGPFANNPLSQGFNFGGSSLTGGTNWGSGFGGYFSNIGPGGANAGNEFYKQLTNAYGSGEGGLIQSILAGGLFNPQVANSMINAMQPGINRGVAGINQAFGAEGARFGSSAALGLGDYLSQVQLNEGQIFAQMYEQAQQEQISLLESTMPTLHSEQANKGGWLHDLLGGLEIGGAIAGTVLTGGAASPFLIPAALAGMQGVSQIAQGVGGGGGSNTGGYNQVMSPFGMPMGTGLIPGMTGYGGPIGTPPFFPGSNYPQYGSYGPLNNPQMNAQITAGASLGGSDPFNIGSNDSSQGSMPGLTEEQIWDIYGPH